MELLRSALLAEHGFAHAFSLRGGGVSAPPFATLNLGWQVGDDPDAVRENRVRFSEALGVAPELLIEVRQVHGAAVFEPHVDGSRRTRPRAPETAPPVEADALVVRAPGIAAGVRTADCVPVLVGDVRSGAVAAIHAGWRGAVAGVVTHAIAALSDDPDHLVVAIGPHIRVDAFEIGEEVARHIESAAPGVDAVDRSAREPHGDLSAIVRYQLHCAGVRAEHIDDVGGCTLSEPERFFSHRRDAGCTGRHLAAIIAQAR